MVFLGQKSVGIGWSGGKGRVEGIALNGQGGGIHAPIGLVHGLPYQMKQPMQQ